MTYEPLKNFEDDYEICNEYPYEIRRIKNGFVPKESYHNEGYIRLRLNGKSYRKHILIAKQFIPNDDPEYKKEVDHINRIRNDYHKENLRWASHSENQRNRTTYNDNNGNSYKVDYIDYEDAPDDIIYLTRYGKHELMDGYCYSFSEDTFYYNTGEAYRILEVRYTNNRTTPYVYVRDIDNKRIRLYINKFNNTL